MWCSIQRRQVCIPREKIIEIGAVRFINGKEAARFHSFVNPGRHIPAFITDLTHISDESVADAPEISDVLPEFEAFVGDDPLVGHNIAFDLGFVKCAGSKLPDKARLYIDTAELARQIVKGPDKVYDQATGKWKNDYISQYEVKSHSLGPMCEFYGLDEVGELNETSTVRKFRTVQREGSRNVSRDVIHYNLDMIISLGYRVKSKTATQFRIWATEHLKEYLIKGFTMNDEKLKEPRRWQLLARAV